ncbi:DUF3696 domain-containing protein [Vibrio fluvialis]|nr:DUF3696 domain-containing protein [Vibrio fluvialis]
MPFLKKINLKNFKSFDSVDIELSNLNIFSGPNSVGKSTIIQSLLLHKQNDRELLYSKSSTTVDDRVPKFSTSGSLLKLGDEKGLLYVGADTDCISIALSSDKFKSELTYCPTRGWEFFAGKITDSSDIREPKAGKDRTDGVFDVLYLLDRIRYISSDRISPQITYQLSKVDISNDSLGMSGEYTAHYLAVNQRKELPIPELKHSKSVTSDLLENVSSWLSEISENIDVNANVINAAQSAAITYEYSYGFNKTNPLTPLHVGFGITHVLPIITQLLIAKQGDLVIIENPESQLHPKAQVKLASLISLAAENGVQIIIETHSDHILNGLRVATKEGLISPNNSKSFFFSRKKDSLAVEKIDISIDEEGSLSNRPQGFFDEWDAQLDKLLW